MAFSKAGSGLSSPAVVSLWVKKTIGLPLGSLGAPWACWRL